MKAICGALIVCAMSLTNTTIANEFRYVDREVRKTESFGERFQQAILPGFSKPDDTYGRTFLAPRDEKYVKGFDSSSSFQAAFTDGRARRYVGNENSSFAADPTSPTGNIFDFKF